MAGEVAFEGEGGDVHEETLGFRFEMKHRMN